MVQNKPIRNFLFLLLGIVLLFCASVPNLADAFSSIARGLMEFLDFGWLSLMLIISRVFLVLAGTALAVVGIIFSIQDAAAAKRQPNWVVIGCVGGGILMALLSLISVLFWIGILGIPALVVAMIFAYKDVVSAWRSPISKLASFLLIGLIIGFWNRFFDTPFGISALPHYLGGLCAIGAFIYFCVWQGKLAAVLDTNGKSACKLMLIGAILYAVAIFFNFIPFVNILGLIVAIAAWVLFLIAYIKLMNCTSFGPDGKKGGMFMMIGHLVALLSFIPIINLAALAMLGLGWLVLINATETHAGQQAA